MKGSPHIWNCISVWYVEQQSPVCSGTSTVCGTRLPHCWLPSVHTHTHCTVWRESTSFHFQVTSETCDVKLVIQLRYCVFPSSKASSHDDVPAAVGVALLRVLGVTPSLVLSSSTDAVEEVICYTTTWFNPVASYFQYYAVYVIYAHYTWHVSVTIWTLGQCITCCSVLPTPRTLLLWHTERSWFIASLPLLVPVSADCYHHTERACVCASMRLCGLKVASTCLSVSDVSTAAMARRVFVW
jgi:hypothetical protein